MSIIQVGLVDTSGKPDKQLVQSVPGNGWDFSYNIRNMNNRAAHVRAFGDDNAKKPSPWHRPSHVDQAPQLEKRPAPAPTTRKHQETNQT
jgi:hypothetical protein